MSHMLKMAALQRGSPIAFVVFFESCNSLFHKTVPDERYARIMMSSILNWVVALTACG